jgi:hypothetical protein
VSSTQIDAPEDAGPDPADVEASGPSAPGVTPGMPAAPATAHPARQGQTSAGANRRSLKLVVTLHPAGGAGTLGAAVQHGATPVGGYRAVMSVDAAGCDPVIRTATGESLAAVLAVVPALVAAAESQWDAQPRYARVSVSGKSQTAAGRPKGPPQPPAVPRGGRPLHAASAPAAPPPPSEQPAAPQPAEPGATPTAGGEGVSAPAGAPVVAAAGGGGKSEPLDAPRARPLPGAGKGAPNGQLSLFGDA